ncbi:MAG: neutral/alkaline non-lysosomal ceramidase N-terminal domain-containing protein [Chitinophagales bacterium]|nr:neutral/alkaline non-lysosomal ceramidase N-terminal domain-containing protein [Chitinophagales bacterium]
MFLVGVSKIKFSPFLPNSAMLGYGLSSHIMKKPGTLFIRAIWIENDSGKCCIVVCELGFITLSIQQGVLNRLKSDYPHFQLNEHNLMITAQHTHSGPSGYSYYPLYNFPTPGFSEKIYKEILEAIIKAIVAAEGNKKEAQISYHQGEFELEKEVAFQRSMHAYNANPDIPEPLTLQTLHKGVNRQMQLLNFTGKDGKPLASINWFGVHTTSLANDLHEINADNKGYAARFLEQHFEQINPDYVGVFAQGICGDVSPRFRYKKNIFKWQRGYWYGKYDDDYKSAEYNGRLQYEKALDLLASSGVAVNGNIKCKIWWVDFTDVKCNPKYTNGVEGASTGPACMGLAFFRGALFDGPGIPGFLVPIARKWIEQVKRKELRESGNSPEVIHKYKTQGVKHIFFETHAGRVLGFEKLDKLIVLSFIDESVRALKMYYQKIASKRKVLYTPKVLPLQLFMIGDLAIAAFPFEITVIAGKRLTQSIKEKLAHCGIREVILAPYANGYSGYITTFEEYQVQMYEGGHTVFGQWSLAALQTLFDSLCEAMTNDNYILKQAAPPKVTLEEMNEFPFYRK